MRRRFASYVWGAVALVALVLGAFFTLQDEAGRGFRLGSSGGLPTFTFYTTPSATAPQIPFWAGCRDGRITNLFNLKVELWKDVDDLQAVLLAGKGDIWLGHLEGFALARKRGAPITLLAVTGWRKFYILSTNPAMRELQDFVGRDLPFTPAGSPAVPVMKALLGADAERVRFQPQEPMQLSMLLVRGACDSALAPEPLVTTMLNKVPGLRVVLSLEEAYGKRTGRPPRMPIAGIAVNERTATRFPREIQALLDVLVEESQKLNADPAGAADVLPDSFAEFMPKEIVKQSLARDMILVKPAADVEGEIADYFKLIAPELVTADGKLALDRGFIWR